MHLQTQRRVATDDAAQSAGTRVRARACALGFALMTLNIYWITVIEVRWYTLDVTSLPIFITPIFTLFVIALLNWLWSLRRGVGLLTGAELTVIYIIIVTGAVFAGHDMLQNLFGAIAHLQRHATPETGWRERFMGYVPHALFVWDEDAVRGFYNGGVSPYRWDWLLIWAKPIALWAGLILTLVVMCLCLNFLVLKQWTQSEKLAFPLIQLPLAMAEPSGGFWQSRWMWAGFSLAISISGLNGLHVLFPSVPHIEWIKQFNIGQFLTTRPWSAAAPFNMSAYPFAVGLAYLMPADLAFSAWFFMLARKGFQVLGAVMGWDAAAGRGFPFLNEQAAGAWLMLGLTLLWSARHTFRDAWRAAWTLDHPERLLYKLSWLGLGAGVIVLALYNALLLRMDFWVAALFFGIYFLLALTITRVRAELGAPHEIYFVNPQRILFDVFTLRGLGVQNLTVLQSLYWFNRGYRCHPMPNQLEALRMGQQYALAPLWLGGLILTVSALAFVIVCWANLHVTYHYGAEGGCQGFKFWLGTESFNRLNTWLTEEPLRHPDRWYYLAGGALMVLGLKGLRSVFTSFPLHPTGYALGVSFAVDYFWFPFLLGWLLKVMLLRFGGWHVHRQGVQFALGLILGDFTMGSLWSIVTLLFEVPTYRIYI
jgi:preprotein translocase subunit SecG